MVVPGGLGVRRVWPEEIRPNEVQGKEKRFGVEICAYGGVTYGSLVGGSEG